MTTYFSLYPLVLDSAHWNYQYLAGRRFNLDPGDGMEF